tara:strand:- start:4030 stop:4983 length:954 start_codon:yes stop_codon:yes gene_type:complete
MKICIVGPGIMPIPPTGWGAVEILIDDYRNTLEKLGHEVIIVNVPNPDDIIRQVNNCDPEFVHIQYDDFIQIVPHLKCDHVAITSHYGYIEKTDRWGGYANIFRNFVVSDVNIFCLSPKILEVYKQAGVPESRLFLVPNGVRLDLFRYSDVCDYPDRSIYLAKIDYRKRQHAVQHIENLYFAGECHDNRFNIYSDRYLGSWSKAKLYQDLTKYANLVLLSDGEAHPLVCMEAMAAGLGLVITEEASANLDTSLEFISVIKESDIDNAEKINSIIKQNREYSVLNRAKIIEYVNSKFDWTSIVENYYLPSVYRAIDNE